MPNSPDLKTMLERLAVPKQFNSSPVLRAWYMEGAQDALEGKPASKEADLSRRLGQQAADAYLAGFQSGHLLKRPGA